MTTTKEQAPRAIRVFARALERELGGHGGKWVATTKSRLLAAADTAAEAAAAARAGGAKDFMLWQVPHPNEPWLF